MGIGEIDSTESYLDDWNTILNINSYGLIFIIFGFFIILTIIVIGTSNRQRIKEDKQGAIEILLLPQAPLPNYKTVLSNGCNKCNEDMMVPLSQKETLATVEQFHPQKDIEESTGHLF